MNKIVVGSIVYNEEHRFLEKYLSNIQKYANEIVLIDDGSTDNSLKMCKEVTKNIFKTNRLFIENEVELRDALWCKCSELCNNGDFILIQDCDELYTESSLQHFHQVINAADKIQADAISFYLYDMWNNKQYREEPPYWTASQRYWVKCIRYKKKYRVLYH